MTGPERFHAYKSTMVVHTAVAHWPATHPRYEGKSLSPAGLFQVAQRPWRAATVRCGLRPERQAPIRANAAGVHADAARRRRPRSLKQPSSAWAESCLLNCPCQSSCGTAAASFSASKSGHFEGCIVSDSVCLPFVAEADVFQDAGRSWVCCRLHREP